MTDDLTYADALFILWIERWFARTRQRGIRRRTDNREGLCNNGTQWGSPAKKAARRR